MFQIEEIRNFEFRKAPRRFALCIYSDSILHLTSRLSCRAHLRCRPKQVASRNPLAEPAGLLCLESQSQLITEMKSWLLPFAGSRRTKVSRQTATVSVTLTARTKKNTEHKRHSTFRRLRAFFLLAADFCFLLSVRSSFSLYRLSSASRHRVSRSLACDKESSSR